MSLQKDTRVAIKSTVKATLGINIPELRLKRDWIRKDAVQYIEFGDLQQAIYTPGVEYMFKTGLLYIEDMATKIALGLEPEDAVKPVHVIVLDDAQRKRYLTVAPIHELKAIVKQLSHDQLIDFANYAVELEITDLSRCEILKAETEIDIIKTVISNRESAAIEKATPKD